MGRFQSLMSVALLAFLPAVASAQQVTNITVQGQGGATTVGSGATLQMVATVTPANAANPAVMWSVTSGTGSASIDAVTGVLTGGSPGTVTVSATAQDGSGVQGSTTITVEQVLVTNITVQGQGGATTVGSGATLQMVATVAPANATNPTVAWSVISVVGSASIDPSTGLLTGATAGVVVVFATAQDGSGIQGSTTITVEQVLVTAITVQGQGGATTVGSGATLQMVATVTPANASNPAVMWSVTSGTGSASIDAVTGLLTGGSPGTVTVSATAQDGSGVQGSTTITVESPAPPQVSDLFVGDVTGDSFIDAADLRAFQQQRLGRVSLNPAVTDLNGDGMIDASDQQLCTRAVLGLPTPMRVDRSRAFESGQIVIVGTHLDGATVTINGVPQGGITLRDGADGADQVINTGLIVDVNATTQDGDIVVMVGAETFTFPGFTTVRTASLSLAMSAVAEGDSGESPMVTATVTLDRPATEAYSFQLVLTGGAAASQATAGSDFVAGPLTVTIPMGASSGVATLTIIGDDVFEADETFVVSLTMPSPSEAVRVDPLNSVAMLTITNDDPQVSAD